MFSDRISLAPAPYYYYRAYYVFCNKLALFDVCFWFSSVRTFESAYIYTFYAYCITNKVNMNTQLLNASSRERGNAAEWRKQQIWWKIRSFNVAKWGINLRFVNKLLMTNFSGGTERMVGKQICGSMRNILQNLLSLWNFVWNDTINQCSLYTYQFWCTLKTNFSSTFAKVLTTKEHIYKF